MRVLALTNLYPNPYQPNRAAFNRQQFGALAADHEVQVIAPIAWTGEWAARRRAGIPRHVPTERRHVRDGMVIHHPRYAFTPKILRGWYGRFFAHSVRASFQEAVRSFRPDCVLGCWAYPDGWAAVQLAREHGLPVVVKVQGSDLLTLGNDDARLKPTIETITRTDAVVAVSRHLGERAVELGASRSRVHVVYNGIDGGVFHPGPREAARRRVGIVSPDPLILFVGNLVPVKGLDVLIDALCTLARTGQRFQCAIVGEGPLRSRLHARIESLGLGAQVSLVGSLPLSHMPDWYRAADLVVLPSRSEGVPNVLLEAAACGTPFIATRVGGIPEIAHPDALVPADDPNALARRIRTFFDAEGHTPPHRPFTPGSWRDSARALAAVLEGVVARAPGQIALAG
jgi:glycosyltransferase involved in cell wall biosynthesis